ncbi:hypothetical protein C8R47DRAFT_85204 [Mycena vitilis]|nr:hypothetical protein C8R47DRAFT_85204 [Mycena vitilis]
MPNVVISPLATAMLAILAIGRANSFYAEERQNQRDSGTRTRSSDGAQSWCFCFSRKDDGEASFGPLAFLSERTGRRWKTKEEATSLAVWIGKPS